MKVTQVYTRTRMRDSSINSHQSPDHAGHRIQVVMHKSLEKGQVDIKKDSWISDVLEK